MEECISDGCNNPREFRKDNQSYRPTCCQCKNSLHYYNMTFPQRERMLADQGGGCKICRTPLSHFKGTTAQAAFVDHCHDTDTVRGILCSHCNRMLGAARDCTTVLRLAAEYLEEFE